MVIDEESGAVAGRPRVICLECQASGELAVYRNQVKHMNKLRSKKAKRLVAAFRKAGCVICSELRFSRLAAHHLNPATKKSNVAKMMGGRTSERVILAELQKCVCLCHNCHSKLHAGKLQLPAGLTATA
jgi:hypothetical protein